MRKLKGARWVGRRVLELRKLVGAPHFRVVLADALALALVLGLAAVLALLRPILARRAPVVRQLGLRVVAALAVGVVLFRRWRRRRHGPRRRLSAAPNLGRAVADAAALAHALAVPAEVALLRPARARAAPGASPVNSGEESKTVQKKGGGIEIIKSSRN
jgi:hypothetical protein